MKLPVIAYIDLVSHVLPVGAGLYRWKFLKRELFILFGFGVVGLLTELITLVMAFKRMNNLWVLHIYNLFEYTLLTVIFSGWASGKRVKAFINLTIPLYAIFWLASKWSFEDWTSPATYTHTLSAVIFTFLSAFALNRIFRSRLNEDIAGIDVPLYKDMHFWFYVGVLLCFTGNVTLFLLLDTVTGLPFLDATNVWSLHWVLSTIVNVCFMAVFLCLRRR